ncbi:MULTISPECIES: DUF4197 domain-containing protein [Mesonia]|uniref:DUF4197 domain-containing protein n=1 Tax=Mesonia sp. TaxID=1960830 RepID=UPI000C5E0ADD|nr:MULTISPECIES: DUF4197 domain-containing protein [Mesonia]MAN25887.1 hypothetical protein [Mesonia sp.]MAN28135.1 hypothetical protein [Mesonia sp.]MAQ39481.1 hypothetical protein [Mesonia sp.]MBJ97020.1 hypothetical protein [Flavobacteriaceae bacterium]
MKRIFLSCLICFSLISCAELQSIAENYPQQGFGLSQQQIANGLKQALDKGIDDQVSKLTQTNGFYKNQLVKILLPQELQKVEQGLRDIGLGSLADEGIKALNRAAEDATKEATPIFVNAIKQMTFTDAKNILLGDNTAATTYLEQKTSQELYNKFNPVIKNSFHKVGADQIWSNIITKYNNIPFTQNVNPDLTDYVTKEALDGVYTMIAVEEQEIRTNIASRTTDLLKRVFALQD